jgi:hypothetical protein
MLVWFFCMSHTGKLVVIWHVLLNMQEICGNLQKKYIWLISRERFSPVILILYSILL